MLNVCNAKETLGKINKESEGELYVTCSIFFKLYEKKMYNGNEKTCEITEKTL